MERRGCPGFRCRVVDLYSRKVQAQRLEDKISDLLQNMSRLGYTVASSTNAASRGIDQRLTLGWEQYIPVISCAARTKDITSRFHQIIDPMVHFIPRVSKEE